MSYTASLYPISFYVSPEDVIKNREQDKADFLAYTNFTDECLSLIEQIEEDPEPNRTTESGGTEGLFSTIGDFFMTMIRTVKRIVEDTVGWIGRKIKSLVNFRVKQKKYRDAKFEQLRQMWSGMPNDKKQEAAERFVKIHLDFTPSFESYRTMCLDFDILAREIEQAAATYIAQDIAIFGVQKAEGQKLPDWIKKLYDNEQSRAALVKFGIKLENEAFVYKSPFVDLPSMTLGDLGYMSPDAVAAVNASYQEHCWKKMKVIVELQNHFKQFERQFEDRSRELKRKVDKMNKKDIAASCKSVSKSVTMAGKLTAYITQVEEALDTRRGWLIDAGLRACSLNPNA